MILSTQIIHLGKGGIILCASADNTNPRDALSEVKSQVKPILLRLDTNSESRASIESNVSSGAYTIHYLIKDSIVYFAITDRSYPRRLVFAYLDHIATEFDMAHPAAQRDAPNLKSYAFLGFETVMADIQKPYNDAHATNLDRINDELVDVTQVLIKNVDDLMLRGESLDRMGELSSRLRDDSKKYRRAAVRINWELMLKQYGPFAGLGFFILVFIWWRFF